MPSQLKQYARHFGEYDRGSMKIEKRELPSLLFNMRIDTEAAWAKDVIAAVEVDKIGKLDFGEFIDLVYIMKKNEASLIFEALDTGLGVLQKEDLAHALRTRGDRMTDAEVSKVFDFFNLHDKEHVSFKDFLNMMITCS